MSNCVLGLNVLKMLNDSGCGLIVLLGWFELFTHGGGIGLLAILMVWTKITTSKDGASTSVRGPESGDELDGLSNYCRYGLPRESRLPLRSSRKKDDNRPTELLSYKPTM